MSHHQFEDSPTCAVQLEAQISFELVQNHVHGQPIVPASCPTSEGMVFPHRLRLVVCVAHHACMTHIFGLLLLSRMA